MAVNRVKCLYQVRVFHAQNSRHFSKLLNKLDKPINGMCLFCGIWEEWPFHVGTKDGNIRNALKITAVVCGFQNLPLKLVTTNTEVVKWSPNVEYQLKIRSRPLSRGYI